MIQTARLWFLRPEFGIFDKETPKTQSGIYRRLVELRAKTQQIRAS